MRILFIRRGRDYSPNSAEKDAEILHKVSMQLGNHGHEVTLADENEASRIIRSYDCVVSMSRDAHTLQLLQDVHNDGTLVINNPQAVMLAGKRKEISKRLSRAGVTTAPAHGNHGYWVKKATGWSMTAKDVMFAQDRSEADSIAALKAEAEQRLAEVEKQKSETLNKLTAQYETYIMFPERKSAISQQQMPMIEGVDAFLKAHPKSKVSLQAAPPAEGGKGDADLPGQRLESVARAISVKTGLELDAIATEVKPIEGLTATHAPNVVKIIIVERKTTRSKRR